MSEIGINTTLIFRIYEVLKSRIINLEYSLGQRIDIRRIAADLSVSQTPIRDAVNSLIRDGLITAEPRRGYYIVNISPKDIQDIYSIREMMECNAIDETISSIDRDELQMYLEMNQKILNTSAKNRKVSDSSDTNLDLHRFIIKSTNNNFLIKFYDMILPFLRIIANLDQLYEESAKDHVLIIRALQKGDGEQAKQVLRKHLAFLKEDRIASLEKYRARTQAS